MYHVQGQRKAVSPARHARGVQAQQDGIEAESKACAMLEARGWRILLRRARTPRGEVDIVADCAGILVFIEVKKRQTMAEALPVCHPCNPDGCTGRLNVCFSVMAHGITRNSGLT